MADDIYQLCSQATSLLLSNSSESRIRIISHYDADGISAAGILCQAIYRQGYNFHASLMRNPFDKGFKRLAEEHPEIIIFADMGSGQIETIEQLDIPAIILDHHQFLRTTKSKKIVQINLPVGVIQAPKRNIH